MLNRLTDLGKRWPQVIQATKKLVNDLDSGETSEIVCTDSVAELGTPSDWSGLSTGEPEEFFAAYWVDQVVFAPQWSIYIVRFPREQCPIPGRRLLARGR